MRTFVLGCIVGAAVAWQAAGPAGQQPTPGGYILERDADVAVNEPGTHNGGGQTVGYSFFKNAPGLKLVFRKRALKPGSGIGYHLQKEDEIYYVLSGRGLMTIDGKSFEVGPGSAVLTRPGSSHGLKQIGNEDLVIMINYEQEAPRIQVSPNDSAGRVDVTIDGKPFTSYIHPSTLKKPVLYPLRTANGTIVTRGFPLEPRAGERVDHPHHVGLWFNHGDVNGLDFWNNSDAIEQERVPKMGTIVHRRVVQASGGAERGILIVEADWKAADGKVLLNERTQYTFTGDGDSRTIDRLTTLTAANEPVVFRDNKEGMIGLRVARELEQPADKAETFTDASGKASAVPVLDNTNVSGEYISSEGLKGDAVWGTRGRWTALTGKIGSERVAIAIFDHPSNPGFPTYWHARGYGLFAANPLGRKVFDPKQSELTLRLEPKQPVTFRHAVTIVTGEVTPDQIDQRHRAFAAASSR
jgi:mannose-6-phosphate isomerase-like protein (cupin superfamily)